MTSSLWNDCKFRTAGSGWSFLSCCKRNAERCYCWCFYRKQNKNSSDSELDFFKAVFKIQTFICLTWKVTFLPRMYTVIQVGFFSLHCCSRLSQLGKCVLSVSRRRNAAGSPKASWTLLSNLVWFGFHMFKCNYESKKALRCKIGKYFFINFSMSSGVFRYNSCFSFTLSRECLPKKITDIILMLSLTEVFVDIYPNCNKVRDLFLLNWSSSKTLNQEIAANAIQTFTEFSGFCYIALGGVP